MVRILVASRRPWAADALATSSYDTNFDQPLSADTLVSAAVKVVLPWSTWPMVPTFTCGFFRSNFAFAMVVLLAGYYLFGSCPRGGPFTPVPCSLQSVARRCARAPARNGGTAWCRWPGPR